MKFFDWQKYRKQIQQQNEMSLVSGSGRIDLPAAIPTDFHLSLTNNMVQNKDEQSNPNMQFIDQFYVEQALAYDHPFSDFPNTAITQDFPPSTEALDALDDASMYRLFSSFDRVLVENPAMLQINDMQQISMMHHNQIRPMNFEQSSIMISGNPPSIMLQTNNM